MFLFLFSQLVTWKVYLCGKYFVMRKSKFIRKNVLTIYSW